MIIGNAISVAAEGETPEITLLTIVDNLVEHIQDSFEYGSTESIFSFEGNVLVGVNDGDDLTFVADASYSSNIVGDATIVLDNFRLSGNDHDKYSIPDISQIEKDIKITAKDIYIRPDIDLWMYYGQNKKIVKLKILHHMIVI